MNVTLEEFPRGCLRRLSEEKALKVLRQVLLNDFKPLNEGQGALSEHSEVCNLKIVNSKGSVFYILFSQILQSHMSFQ